MHSGLHPAFCFCLIAGLRAADMQKRAAMRIIEIRPVREMSGFFLYIHGVQSSAALFRLTTPPSLLSIDILVHSSRCRS